MRTTVYWLTLYYPLLYSDPIGPSPLIRPFLLHFIVDAMGTNCCCETFRFLQEFFFYGFRAHRRLSPTDHGKHSTLRHYFLLFGELDTLLTYAVIQSVHRH